MDKESDKSANESACTTLSNLYVDHQEEESISDPGSI